MKILKHKKTKEYLIYLSDLNDNYASVITPTEGIKRRKIEDLEEYKPIINAHELIDNKILTESQLNLFKKHLEEKKKDDNITKVTEDEFTKVIIFWIIQINEHKNIKFVAENINYRLPKIGRKRYQLFQNELISLMLAIATISVKEYLTNKSYLFDNIIKNVYFSFHDFLFPGSTKFGWLFKWEAKCDEYVRKYGIQDSNSIPLMAKMFMNNLPKFNETIEARVFLSSYINEGFKFLENTLPSYKII